MKWKVTFTQISEHQVGSIVEAESKEEACKKGRDGDCLGIEYDLNHPESIELVRFHATPITDGDAEKWTEDQKAKNRDEDLCVDTLEKEIKEAIMIGPMSEFQNRMQTVWKKHFNKEWGKS